MNFIIVGCGRVGAELAYRLFTNKHQVVVVDNNKQSFNRIHPDFRGRTTEGDALSADTLERAGIDKADGIAIVTNSDTMNVVVGHMVRTRHPHVKQIIVRNYDPAMREMLEAFGLQIVSSTAWGAERVQELLIDPSFRAVYSAGNGEVEMYEMAITPRWDGKKIADILSASTECVALALTRAGRAEMPSPEKQVRTGDILTVSATLDGVKNLRACLQE